MAKASSTFAKNLRAAREGLNLSQRQLAQRTKLTAQYVSLLEAGDRAPSLDVLGRLAKALGVTAASLLDVPEVTP